ncbi:MAG: glycosyltransferase [Bacteroidetes bacterium]|nr:glycosyltransferase [Bacteroidota bacterium]
MADTLPEMLEALFQFRAAASEVIVVDDGSTDHVDDVVAEFSKKAGEIEQLTLRNVRIPNSGRASAINKGVEQAMGTYISFLDADDRIIPSELEKCWLHLIEKKSDIVISQFRIIDNDIRTIAIRELDIGMTPRKIIKKIAFWPISPVHLNTFLIKKEYLQKIGLLDPLNLKSEDKDLIIRLLRGGGSVEISDAEYYHYIKHSLPRSQMAKKRIGWMQYRQRTINQNFEGFERIGSKLLQGGYDIAKLVYEFVTKYRL